MLEKDKFHDLSIKVGKILKKLKISPNGWTFISLLFAFVSAFLIIKQKFLVASIFLLFSALMDFFDGAVARATKKTTLFGAYLDTIVDRYVEAIILFSFLFLPLPSFILKHEVWVFLALTGSLMTTYAKAAAKEKEILKKELTTSVFGRAIRTTILFFAVFFASFSFKLTILMIFFLALISNFTAIKRIINVLQKAKS